MSKSKNQDTIEVPRELLDALCINTIMLKLGTEADSQSHPRLQHEINQAEALLNPPPEIEEEDPRQMSLPGVE